MTKLQALIFDLDGTLIDSAPDLRQALNQTLKGQGRRAVTLEETQAMLGDGMLATLKRAFHLTGAPLDNDEAYRLFQDFVVNYRELKADPAQIYPGVVAMLDEFQKRGVKLGLCTNKPEASTHKLLDELRLSNYFAFVAGGDTYQVHKPHPDHVKGVMEALQATADGCVMVGDNRNDALAAHGCGIPCIAVGHGYSLDLKAIGADRVIGGFAELAHELGRMGFELTF